MKKIFLIISIIIISISKNFAQKIENEYFATNVKTASIRANNDDFAYPIAEINESISLSFDILDNEYDEICYEILHCNSNFEIDDLDFMQFAEGFENQEIKDYQNSFNTLQNYTHYTLEIPNEDIKLKLSGNYIIRIFPQDDKENILLQKKFMIVKPNQNPKVEASISKSIFAEQSYFSQQINLEINLDNYKVINPQKNIKVYIMQNKDINNRHKLENTFVGNNLLKFCDRNVNNFDGISEFRYFDAKDVNFANLGCEKIYFDKDRYTFKLSTLNYLDFRTYTFSEDLNGDFYIKNDRGFNNDLEADYVNVEFNLKYDLFANEKIYVVGDFNSYNLDNQLFLNESEKVFKTKLTLKQGLYNYSFVSIDNNNQKNYPLGNFYQTRNQYTIFVYYYNPQNFCDELVKVLTINN